MASTAHDSSKKRRFQPPITNFFTSTLEEESTGLSHNSYAAPTNTPTPALPTNILSSLLGVGARVRKSVPEGYKTEQKKMTQYTIPAPVQSRREETSSSIQSHSTQVYAELEPFCGLHKIGNHAVQTFPRPIEEYQNAVHVDELETISIPNSSQDSSGSSSFSTNLNKRSFDADIEEDDDIEFPATVFHSSGDFWQRPLNGNFNSGSAPAVNMRSQRTILSPKLGQQRRQRTAQNHSWKSNAEQENQDPFLTAENTRLDLDDFDEATFLRRRDEVDADHLWSGSDVEMDVA
ncbi:uncharacterized protein TRUGW13939_09070 [Talaromyces rugulosus]|uniref:Uncharacterized protein n=1 Tax=Talaromyces rugulosus TaxID=121627 RepID=A0A7H8R6B5_TALRU|nr:uncharacterized protein TRUGW13939_09070 [Talaromyces rugulosus]QKX61914.1 hypothetical protein TRUGW13939_09070 [Talaromyces rugulosus]